MPKQRNLALDYAVYLVVRVLVCLLQAMSWRLGATLADGLGWLLYRVDRRHRAVAHDNLRHAFPELTDAARDQRVRAVYRHLCRIMVEIAHIPRKLHTGSWRRYVHLREGAENVDVLLSGRPLLLVTGHFGNWEMGSIVLGLLGFNCYAIARPLDNRYVDDYLRRFREATGQKLLAKKGDFDQMEQILSEQGVIGTVADQDAGPRGPFVEFFGRPASTHKAVALMALEHQTPIVVMGVAKIAEPMRYQVRIPDIIMPEDYADRPDAVRAITQRFSSGLERLVRDAPDQYFWLHRRWKHQPKKPRQKAA